MQYQDTTIFWGDVNTKGEEMAMVGSGSARTNR
jgi:hypothetical protein